MNRKRRKVTTEERGINIKRNKKKKEMIKLHGGRQMLQADKNEGLGLQLESILG